MRDQTNLIKRGNVYYFRKKIPSDLKSHFPGASGEVRVSLKTSDKRVAAPLALAKAHAMEQDFERIRKGLQPKHVTSLSPEVIPLVTQSVVASMLMADEEMRMGGMSDDEFDQTLSERETAIKDARADYARGRSTSVDGKLEDWLHSFSIEADPQSAAFKRLVREFLTSYLRALEGQHKRDQGEIVETPHAPEGAASLGRQSAPGLTLESLTELWATERTPERKTVTATEGAVREFKEIVGHTDTVRLNKGDVVKFKDELLRRHPGAPKSAWKKLMLVKTVVNLAEANDRIKENVFKSVQISVPTNVARSRVGFEAADLEAIFGTELFKEKKLPKAGNAGGVAAYWIPLIGLFTGMRLEEIAQLHVADVKQEGDIWYFDVTNEGERRTKNIGSVRKVPVHCELIRLGLVKFVRGINDQEGRLFPLLKRDSQGILSSGFSKWFGRFLRTDAKVTDERKVFHSFRHGFKTACRVGGIQPDVHNAITGHSDGTEGSNYGEVPLITKDQAVQKISFHINLDRNHSGQENNRGINGA
ncbi:site-specific integrase [Caballeronia sp. ATUFL_M1_KS5A]|uniref:site-specific integrase n=1 Tax=Caballeronia sp. ATUFL_M1_KS5A TaxID=2921778 RepID=UPI002027AD0F|nr:site-specific integrase [Caballeronia sp. ATUFL_M1_KS5A]